MATGGPQSSLSLLQRESTPSLLHNCCIGQGCSGAQWIPCTCILPHPASYYTLAGFTLHGPSHAVLIISLSSGTHRICNTNVLAKGKKSALIEILSNWIQALFICGNQWLEGLPMRFSSKKTDWMFPGTGSQILRLHIRVVSNESKVWAGVNADIRSGWFLKVFKADSRYKHPSNWALRPVV